MTHRPASPFDYDGIKLTKARTAQIIATIGYLAVLAAIITGIGTLVSLHAPKTAITFSAVSTITFLIGVTLPTIAAARLRRNNRQRLQIIQTWATGQGYTLTRSQANELLTGRISKAVYGSTLITQAGTSQMITLIQDTDTYRLIPTSDVKKHVNIL